MLTDDILAAAVKDKKRSFSETRGKGQNRFLRRKSKDRTLSGLSRHSGAFGRGRAESVATFDLMAVPGVVFDENGGRIGYGKGYYDRILSEARCRVVALAFDFQVLTEVPSEEHDMTVGRSRKPKQGL